MIKNYEIPKSSKAARNSNSLKFDLKETLKSLANNKHNDCTTTYYLLYKKWLKSNPDTKLSDHLVKLTDSNHEQIAYKIEHEKQISSANLNQNGSGNLQSRLDFK
jgi:hypothetical protein